MRRTLLGVLVFASTGWIFFQFPGMTEASDVVLIVNKEVSDNSLSRDDVKKIFKGKKVKWSDGGNIRFVTLKTSAHKAFLKAYVRTSPRKYKMYWKKMIFTGRGKMPKSFGSDAAMADYVAATPGAIGYVSSAASAGNCKMIPIMD